MVFVFGWYDLWLIDYVSCLCHLKISITTWQVINKQWNQDDLRSRYLDSHWKGWQTRMLVAWHNLIDTVGYSCFRVTLQTKFSIELFSCLNDHADFTDVMKSYMFTILKKAKPCSKISSLFKILRLISNLVHLIL